MLNEKLCTGCNTTKQTTEFNKRRNVKNGYQPECRDCCKIRISELGKTKSGLIGRLFNRQKANSKKRKHPQPSYSLPELREWCDNLLFHKLYDEWVASGYQTKLRPSIDRLNDYKPYTFDNIQIVTWHQNMLKGSSDRFNCINNKINKSVIQYDMNNIYIKTHGSLASAARAIGVSPSVIGHACSGKQKTSGGFIWEYNKDISSISS